MLDVSPARQLIIRVMLVASDPGLVQTVKLHLTDRFPIDLVATVQSGRECLDVFGDTDPAVVVIADQLPDIAPLQLVRQITMAYPGVAVVVLSQTDDAPTYQEIMSAGARGVVKVSSSPQGWIISGEELDTRIRQGMELVRPVREQQARAMPARQRKLGGEVITIYSAKGGVGKSTCAVALAALFAQRDPRAKVALVDLNLQFGVESVFLNLQPYHSIIDLIANASSLGTGTLDTLVAKKDLGNGSELHYVAAPPDPHRADQVYGQNVTGVLTTLRRYHDFTILDTTATISDVTLAAMQASTRIFLICTQDMLAIRQTRAALEFLSDPEFGIDSEVFSLIINRVNRHSEIKPESIGALFDIPCIGLIPEDPAFFETVVNVGQLGESLGQGTPVIKAWKDILAQFGPGGKPPR